MFFVAIALVAVIAGIAGLVATTVGAVLVALLCAAIAILAVHTAMAVFIVTRRPQRRVWAGRAVWATGSLVLGLPVFLLFLWLHYLASGSQSCFRCGYDRSDLTVSDRCPECGILRV